MLRIKYYFLISLTVLLFWGNLNLSAQQGANRFQYHHNKWEELRNGKNAVYHPQQYDTIAQYTLTALPYLKKNIALKSGVDIKEGITIVLYPSIGSMYSSNIGIAKSMIEKLPFQKSANPRIVVGFNGSHKHYLSNLEAEILRQAIKEKMDYFGMEEQIVPDWFMEGMIAYFVYGWTSSDEDKVVQYAKLNSGFQFIRLIQKQDPQLFAKAICYYVERNYRDDGARQILSRALQRKRLEKCFFIVLGEKFTTIIDKAGAYYKDRSLHYPAALDTINTLRYQLQLLYDENPILLQRFRDSMLVFVSEKSNIRKAYLVSLPDLQKRRKAKPFYKTMLPPWIIDKKDNPYPLIAVNEKKGYLDLAQEEKGKTVIKRFNLFSRRQLANVGFKLIDGIYTLGGYDKKNLYLSAFRLGQSDVLSTKVLDGRIFPITNDIADNLDVTVSDDVVYYRSGLYLPNDDTLMPYGIYRRFLNETKAELFKEDSAYIAWHEPKALSNAIVLSNNRTGSWSKDTFSVDKSHDDAVIVLPWAKDYSAIQRKKDSIAAVLSAAKTKDVFTNLFAEIGKKDSKQLKNRSIVSMPYRIKLYRAYYFASLSNENYINRLQPYAAYQGIYKVQEPTAMFGGAYGDIFENHSFAYGYRMPLNGKGSEFYLLYKNISKNWDWSVRFQRKVEQLIRPAGNDWTDAKGRPYPAFFKVKTFHFSFSLHRPIDYYWSAGADIAIRRDKTVFIATDKYSLNYSPLFEYWNINNLYLKGSKINKIAPLMYEGWDFRLWTDVMLGLDKKSVGLYGLQGAFERHLLLFNTVALSGKLQAAWSWGVKKILYNLGGTDGNITTLNDSTKHFSKDGTYAFHALVTPFRGYAQNSAYGHGFLAASLDVYLPLCNILNVRSRFAAVNHFQIGVFTDWGSVFRNTNDGLLPTPKTLFDFGFSARTLLAGYPVRFDMGWPATGGKPIWYLSLNFIKK